MKKWIVFVLASLSSFVIGFFLLDVPSTVGMMVVTASYGAIGSIILAIVGFFIDKLHK